MINEYVMMSLTKEKKKKFAVVELLPWCLKIYHRTKSHPLFHVAVVVHVQKNYGSSILFFIFVCNLYKSWHQMVLLYFDINHATEIEHEYNLQDEAS